MDKQPGAENANLRPFWESRHVDSIIEVRTIDSTFFQPYFLVFEFCLFPVLERVPIDPFKREFSKRPEAFAANASPGIRTVFCQFAKNRLC